MLLSEFKMLMNVTWNAAKGDEYTLYRKEAQQHWDSMKTSYQKVRWL